MNFFLGLMVGFFGGGALSYLYAQAVIKEYRRAAATIGIGFDKIEGKIQAIKKAL